MAYCIYTGASAIMKDVKDGKNDAKARMETFLRALRGALGTCPVVQRSIDIINNSLQQRQTGGQAAMVNNDVAEVTPGYLPAFPNHDPQLDIGNMANLGSVAFDAFAFLDCFPENSMNMDIGEWYMPMP